MVKNIQTCNVGVRQEEKMFPVLFALFLNDFEEIVQINDIDRLKSISDEIGTQFNYYLKLFVILYTDDTVLMSESQEDVQKQHFFFLSYTNITGLNILHH
jgi:hypothetical protein